MPIQPVTHHSWIFTPPLDMPLALRTANGRFDSLRPQGLGGRPPCATDHVIDADDPLNPTGEDFFFANALHQAVDLASVADNCVYAAGSGRVVEVETNAAQTRGNVLIDHHPFGLGFLTKYLHITGIQVSEGEFVSEGQPFAKVSAEPESPHLHFALWAIVDRREGPPGPNDIVPIDPTRALYAWEQRLEPDVRAPGAQVPLSVGTLRHDTFPFFFARPDSDVTVHVPMYEPMTEEERVLVALLREAHERGNAVELSFRRSAFWGLDIVTQAALV